MPISLPPLSRRRFLASSLAAGTGLLAGQLRWAYGAQAVDKNRFAILSDTHIAADHAAVNRGVNMFANLVQVTAELTQLQPRPAAVIVNGDCAYLTGQSADYAIFLDPINRLRQAGYPIHLTLGNHDSRERFWAAIPPEHGEEKPVEHRHVAIIETPRANWFILDSLLETNHTPGVLGEQQLAWLASALDSRPDKPALVMSHHNPDMPGKAATQPFRISGLTDTQPLLDVLLPRKQVKVWFFGHTHDWHHARHDDLHLVNFPPVAYVFTPGKPSGWVDAQLADTGATLQLHATDAKHPQNGEKVELKWR